MPTATLPLQARMADAYMAASDFALAKWCDACVEVERCSGLSVDHGPSASYGRAILQREFWADQSERCERLAKLLVP